MISLYRISAETPEALSSCKTEIFRHAISSELPHVGIREYAKRTLLQLISASAISATQTENEQIMKVNTAVKGQSAKKKDTNRSFGDIHDGQRRFKFDEMDTIRYWYEDILRIFPTVSKNQVLEIAERWILDKWGAEPEANWWDKEPRKSRYEERRYGLWSHDHGTFPVIERYGTHLEWNAMYCVVGELLLTHPIEKREGYYFDSLDYCLQRILPTEAPAWLFDNRGPTPLEYRLWNEDPRTDIGWLHNVRRDEFLAEIGLHKPSREGWIIVEGSYSVHFSKRETHIQINTALVTPKTAPALVRALQTASSPWDFRIPDDHDEGQINMPPYRLLGWLSHNNGDRHFDERDPFRYEVGQIRTKPSSKLIKSLVLTPAAKGHFTWTIGSASEAAFIYEAWCDEPPQEGDYYPERINSDGWRLWARANMVRSFLTNEGLDLICEVQVERRLRNEYRRSYEADKKSKTHDKILLLRADGSIADARGRIGAWTSFSQRAGT